jgi:hypothetical protein
MTHSLNDIIKGIEKQNPQNDGLLGFSSLHGLSIMLEQHKKANFSFSGLRALTDIAKTISQQMKSLDIASTAMGNSFAQISVMKPPKHHTALFGLTSSLSEIAKSNLQLSNTLSSFTINQLLLSNNLASIANSLGQTHLHKFNSFDIALQGISKSYLKNIALTGICEEISIADEATKTVANIADELLTTTHAIRADDFEKLKVSIITELSGLLIKTKTAKAKQFVLEFITIISFLLIFYNPFVSHADKTNTEVIEGVKSQIEKINKDLAMKIENELHKLNKTRIAITNVNLRYSGKHNSKIIGIVSLGQQVTVIEIRHKYLLISYIDKDTKESKSGFVIKKYFINEKE